MAVLSVKAVAATVANLTSRVRRMVGDTDSDTNNQRWLDADIRAEIDHQLAQMYSEVASMDPSGFLQTTTMSYTADASNSPVALPTGLEGNSIYKVEDYTDSSAPLYFPYRSVLELSRFRDERGWSLVGNAIVISPQPVTTATLRIYTLAPFIPTTSTTTDQHSLSINHEELICLGAAIRLQENDNEIPLTRISRYQTLWEQYQKTAARYIGRKYVRNTRKLV